MKVLIIGCGAIGAFYASKLYKAGHCVVVTARGEHFRAISEKGLTVTHDQQSCHILVNVTDHDELQDKYVSDEFDIIIISLKANQTHPFLDKLSDWLVHGSTPVLSIQNGVDNELAIAELIGEQRTWGGLAVKIGGSVAAPGLVETTGLGKLVIGPWPCLKENAPFPETFSHVAQQLTNADIVVEKSKHIQKELWKKLVINNGVNPLSAIVGLDTYALTHQKELADIVYEAMKETITAARHDGVFLSQEDLDDMFHLIKTFNPIKTSMLIDKEKSRPMEIDAIIGSVLQRCHAMGKPAPYNQMMWAILSQVSCK